MTARLGNAALVIALALALGIAGDLTLAATNSDHMLADTDLTPVAAPSPPNRTRPARGPAERANAERSRRLRGCTEGARCMRRSHEARCTAGTISCRYGVASGLA